MGKRNVVLICLDTVRKDYFDGFAPRLQQLADVSVDECRAASSWTVPSHASLFTGQLPHQHGIHAENVDFTSLDAEGTFLNALADHRAIGVSANAYVDSAFGFDTMFDEFYDVAPGVVFADGMYLRDFESSRDGPLQLLDYATQAATHDHPLKSFVNGLSYVGRAAQPSFLSRRDDDGAAVVSKLATQVVERTEEPYFLFLNYMDAHGPFEPTTRYDNDLYSVPSGWSSHDVDIWEFNRGHTEPYAEDVQYYRELYRAAIDYLDRRIERLVTAIEQRSTGETTFIITSDHGENLGYEADDRLLEHKGSLTEGLLHVPLLIRNPPEPIESADGYLSQLDLGTMIVDIAQDQLSVPTRPAAGAELVGLGGDVSDLEEDEYEYWNRTIRAIYSGEQKFLWDSTGARVSYRLDRGESCTRLEQLSTGLLPEERSEFFDVELDGFHPSERQDSGSVDVDKTVETRLDDLGYM